VLDQKKDQNILHTNIQNSFSHTFDCFCIKLWVGRCPYCEACLIHTMLLQFAPLQSSVDPTSRNRQTHHYFYL